MSILDDIDAVLAAQPDLFEHVVDDLFPATWTEGEIWASHQHGCLCDTCVEVLERESEQRLVCECPDDRLVHQFSGREPISIVEMTESIRMPICWTINSKIGDGFLAYGKSATSQAYLAGLRGERMPMEVALEFPYGWPPEIDDARDAGLAEGRYLDGLTSQQ